MEIVFGQWMIRSHEVSDIPALVRHANNPKVAETLADRFPHPYREADALAFLAEAASCEGCHFLALAEVGGELIGGIGVHRLKGIRRVDAELGYWLGERYWGRGIATAAVEAFTPWVFGALSGLERVHAHVFASNPASARVLEKAGYLLEGRLRRSVIKGGVVLDQLLYATLRGAWPEA